MEKSNNILTPIVGQGNLIGEIDRIIQIFVNSACKIRPHFILTGESGSGKSITIASLCAKHKLSLIEVNAAQLTKEGTSGNSLSKALTPLMHMSNRPCVVFVDEWDKLHISGNSNDSIAHETTSGVQNEFLKVLESDITSVYGDYGKYVNASTKNVLFIFAGAFNGEENITIDRLREMGVKTEFLGRVGLIYNTKKLTLEDMYAIIDNNPLVEDYAKLFPKYDSEKARLLIKDHIKKNYENNTLGARLINTLVHQYFIKGGKLSKAEVKELAFQRTMD